MFFLTKGCISLSYAWYFSHISDISGREGDREGCRDGGREGDREGLIVRGHIPKS